MIIRVIIIIITLGHKEEREASDNLRGRESSKEHLGKWEGSGSLAHSPTGGVTRDEASFWILRGSGPFLSSLSTVPILVSLPFSPPNHFSSCFSLYSWFLSMAALPVFLPSTSCITLSVPPEKGSFWVGWSSSKKEHTYPALGHLISYWATIYVMWLLAEKAISSSNHHGQDIYV